MVIRVTDVHYSASIVWVSRSIQIDDISGVPLSFFTTFSRTRKTDATTFQVRSSVLLSLKMHQFAFVGRSIAPDYADSVALLYTPQRNNSKITIFAFCQWHRRKTRHPAVARIADRTGCQWPSVLSKLNNFHLIWRSVCHFLLVININLGSISHCFRDVVSSPLQNAHFLSLHLTPNLKLLSLHYIAEISHA